jgi:hypothetical protein
MEHSESISKLSAALVAAQAELPHIPFDETNPFLKSEYASLGSVIETERPILAKFHLAVTQLVISENDKIGVETVLIHESGEWISTKAMMFSGDEKGKSTAQVAGSIVSYLRRYSLAAILGMYADKDEDGNGKQASKPAPAKVTAPAAPASVNKIMWTVEQKSALITNNLAKNEFGAKGMLGLSNLPATATPELIAEWGKQYRTIRNIEAKDEGPTSTDAATQANNWYTTYKQAGA